MTKLRLLLGALLLLVVAGVLYESFDKNTGSYRRPGEEVTVVAHGDLEHNRKQSVRVQIYLDGVLIWDKPHTDGRFFQTVLAHHGSKMAMTIDQGQAIFAQCWFTYRGEQIGRPSFSSDPGIITCTATVP